MVKEDLGVVAKGHKILENEEGFELREEGGAYMANNDGKKEDIGGQNAYYWNVSC